ncbi:copper homeostasis periplasmic binding protein CopC [Salinicola sp. CR57]|uniref:copper homeostasis periplasmic binding protein CopC n=1 Tax=Salinicola sp. CR57 TaxID=1949086 RepID=UPI000DA1F66A|nr:copper homeostasis periplasmic binding protein CopC [Salinicola sp. CR57]
MTRTSFEPTDLKRPPAWPRSLARLALIGLCLVSAQAFAHAHLDSASPAEDAEVGSPATIELGFTEALELPFSGIELVDADGNAVELGETTLDDDDKTLVAPVTEPLDPGHYEVQWHVLSVDGHKTEGDYRFDVTP